MRYTSILASASVLALSIISTTFVLLTLTSKRWAVQNYYYSGVIGAEGDGSLNVNASTWAYRSPFYRCGVPEVYENKTGNVQFCQFYKPYGRNTSCRTSGEMGLPSKQVLESHGVLGTSQECQQVHYAGNLQIAASVFTALALLLSLIVCLLSLAPRRGQFTEAHATHAPHTPKHRTDAAENHHHHHGLDNHHNQEPVQQRRMKHTPTIVVFLLGSLYIGAVLQIFAQLFGILGLTVTASPNSRDANGNQPDTDYNMFTADDWTIDLALSRYATVAWTSALAAAAVATVLFKTPTFRKFV